VPPKEEKSRLADALKLSPQTRLCAVCSIRARLDGDDLQALEDVLDIMVKNVVERNHYVAKRYSAKWLANTLTANGYPMSQQQIIRWVRRKCDCR
jgi:hypothetical protein